MLFKVEHNCIKNSQFLANTWIIALKCLEIGVSHSILQSQHHWKYVIINPSMKHEETRFPFASCPQFFTGFVILMSFILLGSNNFTCPLAFLYLIRTDSIPFPSLFPRLQNESKPSEYAGRSAKWEEGDLVGAWTSSLHMNLLPADSCTSVGQLPIGRGAHVWYRRWRVCVIECREI